MTKLYTVLIAESYQEQTRDRQQEKKQLALQLKEYESRLSRARELVVADQIEPEDFREVKAAYSEKIDRLEAKLSAIKEDSVNIEGLLNEGIGNLLKLNTAYQKGESADMRWLIGSIYPEKLVFDGQRFRTTRVNEVVKLIYQTNSELKGNKNWTSRGNSNLSSHVGVAGNFDLPVYR